MGRLLFVISLVASFVTLIVGVELFAQPGSSRLPVIVQQTPQQIQTDWTQLVLQGGSFGLLCIIVFAILKYVPTHIRNNREDKAESEKRQLAEKAASEERILKDKAEAAKQFHDDKIATLQAQKEDRHELRSDITKAVSSVVEDHEKDRQAFIAEMKLEREACAKQSDKIMEAVTRAQENNNRALETMSGVLRTLEASNRNVASAIQGVTAIGKSIAEHPPNT